VLNNFVFSIFWYLFVVKCIDSEKKEHFRQSLEFYKKGLTALKWVNFGQNKLVCYFLKGSNLAKSLF